MASILKSLKGFALNKKRKNLVLLAGVSAAGKTFLIDEMQKSGFLRVVTSTTRRQRSGETDGIDYHFVSIEELQKQHDSNKLIEHASIRGETYGTTYQNLNDTFEKSDKAYVILDPQGVNTYQKYFEHDDSINITTVFLDCPNDIQVERLINRLPNDYTEAQLNDVAKSLVVAKNFESQWKEMMDIHIYIPYSESTETIKKTVKRIEENLGQISSLDSLATKKATKYTPEDEEIQLMAEFLRK